MLFRYDRLHYYIAVLYVFSIFEESLVHIPHKRIITTMSRSLRSQSEKVFKYGTFLFPVDDGVMVLKTDLILEKTYAVNGMVMAKMTKDGAPLNAKLLALNGKLFLYIPFTKT